MSYVQGFRGTTCVIPVMLSRFFVVSFIHFFCVKLLSFNPIIPTTSSLFLSLFSWGIWHQLCGSVPPCGLLLYQQVNICLVFLFSSQRSFCFVISMLELHKSLGINNLSQVNSQRQELSLLLLLRANLSDTDGRRTSKTLTGNGRKCRIWLKRCSEKLCSSKFLESHIFHHAVCRILADWVLLFFLLAAECSKPSRKNSNFESIHNVCELCEQLLYFFLHPGMSFLSNSNSQKPLCLQRPRKSWRRWPSSEQVSRSVPEICISFLSLIPQMSPATQNKTRSFHHHNSSTVKAISIDYFYVCSCWLRKHLL